MYPDPLASVERALEGLPDDVKRRVLRDDAAELYRVELPPVAR